MSGQQSTGTRMEPEKISPEELRARIVSELPNGAEWLKTSHWMLGGETPEDRIQAGDVESVHHLLQSILYVGII